MANEFKVKNGIIISGSADIEQNLTVRGTLTADQYNVSIISTSILYESGSTKFGNTPDDAHDFTGSVNITGSINLNGQAIGTGKLDETTFNSYTSSINTTIKSKLDSDNVISGSIQVNITGTTGYSTFSGSISSSISDTSSSINVLSSSVSTSIGVLSSSIATTDLNQNNKLLSLEGASGSIRNDFNSFTSSYTTGSFTGSFKGDGSGLYNIPSSGVTGLELNKIISGSVSASISPNRGLEINANTTITGSVNITGSTTQTGNNTLIGNTTLSGSINVSGSQTFIGTNTITGSVNISGSTNQTGNNTLIGNTILSGGIIISSSFPVGSLTSSVKIYGDTTMTGYLKFEPQSTNIDTTVSASYIFVSGSTDDLYFSQNSKGLSNITRLRWLEGNLYTGLLNGGIISATPGGTTFNVAAGGGIIVDLNGSLTEDPYPTVTHINWNTFTGQSLTYRTTNIQTFIGIDQNGAITQQTEAFSNGTYNTQITLGTVIHQNLSTVNATINYPNLAYGYKQRTYDFIKAFGPLKLSGLNIIPVNTLGLNVGTGNAYADGRNYQNDPNNPSYITDLGTNISKIFRYYQVSGTTFIQDTNNASGYTELDVTHYNNNGTLTLVPGTGVNRQWSLQRIFWYPNSATKGIVAYYGNKTYTSSTEAAANLPYESFFEAENTKQNAVYLGAIAVRNDATWADSASYLILGGGTFRNVGGSGGGGNVPSNRFTDLIDVDVVNALNGDLPIYNNLTGLWQHGKHLTGDYQITGSLLVSGGITGSIDYSNITNKPTLVSGSSQIDITGTTGYSTFSSSISTSIGSLSSSIATTTNDLDGRIDNLETESGSIRSNFNSFTSSYATGAFTGSFIGNGSGLYNIPASGVTGLSLDKIINGNASASIDNNGFYVNRDVYIDGTITAKEIHTDYVTSSVLFQSGSTKFGNTVDDTHQFTGSLHMLDESTNFSIVGNSFGQTSLISPDGALILTPGIYGVQINGTFPDLKVNGNIIADGTISSSFTGSGAGLYNLPYSGLTNVPTLVSGSSQISYTGITNIPNGIVSGSSQILSGTNIVSGSEQLTGSYDTRYVLSGSITQTTWDNIANKPTGIVSGSQQIINLGFLETSSYNTMSSSINSRVGTLELNDYSQDTKISLLTNKTGSYATTGSNIFIGIEQVTGSLLVSGSVVISGSLDISNANVGSSRFLFTQTVASTTWNIVHNLGYNYPNVIVYDGSNNKVMIPADVTSIDANTTQVTFATAEYGYALVSVGGITTATADRFLFTATSATGSWIIDHNMGYKYVNIDVYDNNDEQLIPQKVTAVSVNRTQVDFSTPTSGNAIITLGGPRSAAIFNQTGSYYNTNNNIGITGSLIVTGDVDAANFNTTSDKKLKIDLIRIEGALDKIEKLNGYTFNWLEEYSEDRTRQIGLIADEVYEVQPELISNRSILLGGKEEEIKLLDYSKVTALLLEGIKELTERVTKLENKRKKK